MSVMALLAYLCWAAASIPVAAYITVLVSSLTVKKPGRVLQNVYKFWLKNFQFSTKLTNFAKISSKNRFKCFFYRNFKNFVLGLQAA